MDQALVARLNLATGQFLSSLKSIKGATEGTFNAIDQRVGKSSTVITSHIGKASAKTGAAATSSIKQLHKAIEQSNTLTVGSIGRASNKSLGQVGSLVAQVEKLMPRLHTAILSGMQFDPKPLAASMNAAIGTLEQSTSRINDVLSTQFRRVTEEARIATKDAVRHVSNEMQRLPAADADTILPAAAIYKQANSIAQSIKSTGKEIHTEIKDTTKLSVADLREVVKQLQIVDNQFTQIERSAREAHQAAANVQRQAEKNAFEARQIPLTPGKEQGLAILRQTNMMVQRQNEELEQNIVDASRRHTAWQESQRTYREGRVREMPWMPDPTDEEPVSMVPMFKEAINLSDLLTKNLAEATEAIDRLLTPEDIKQLLEWLITLEEANAVLMRHNKLTAANQLLAKGQKVPIYGDSPHLLPPLIASGEIAPTGALPRAEEAQLTELEKEDAAYNARLQQIKDNKDKLKDKSKETSEVIKQEFQEASSIVKTSFERIETSFDKSMETLKSDATQASKHISNAFRAIGVPINMNVPEEIRDISEIIPTEAAPIVSKEGIEAKETANEIASVMETSAEQIEDSFREASNVVKQELEEIAAKGKQVSYRLSKGLPKGTYKPVNELGVNDQQDWASRRSRGDVDTDDYAWEEEDATTEQRRQQQQQRRRIVDNLLAEEETSLKQVQKNNQRVKRDNKEHKKISKDHQISYAEAIDLHNQNVRQEKKEKHLDDLKRHQQGRPPTKSMGPIISGKEAGQEFQATRLLAEDPSEEDQVDDLKRYAARIREFIKQNQLLSDNTRSVLQEVAEYWETFTKKLLLKTGMASEAVKQAVPTAKHIEYQTLDEAVRDKQKSDQQIVDDVRKEPVRQFTKAEEDIMVKKADPHIRETAALRDALDEQRRLEEASNTKRKKSSNKTDQQRLNATEDVLQQRIQANKKGLKTKRSDDQAFHANRLADIAKEGAERRVAHERALIQLRVVSRSAADKLRQIFGSIMTVTAPLTSAIQKALQPIVGTITRTLAPIGNAIRNALQPAVNTIRNTLQPVLNRLSPIFAKVGSAVRKVGNTIGKYIGRKSVQSTQNLASAASTVAALYNTQIPSAIQGTTKAMQRHTWQVRGYIKDTTRVITGILISQGFYRLMATIQQATRRLFEFNAEMQRVGISFKFLLGNKKQADAFTEAMRLVAERTQMSFEQVLTSARRMMAAGFEARHIAPMFTSFADALAVAGARPDAFERLVYAITQIRAAGRLMGTEMRQLTEIPIQVRKYLMKYLDLPVEAFERIGDQHIPAGKAIGALLKGFTEYYGGAAELMEQTTTALLVRVTERLLSFGDRVFGGVFEQIRQHLINFSNLIGNLRDAALEGRLSETLTNLIPPYIRESAVRLIESLRALWIGLKDLWEILRPIVQMLINVIFRAISFVVAALAILVRVLADLVKVSDRTTESLRRFAAILVFLLIIKPIFALVTKLVVALKTTIIALKMIKAVGLSAYIALKGVGGILAAVLAVIKAPLVLIISLIVGLGIAVGVTSNAFTNWLTNVVDGFRKAVGIDYGELFPEVPVDTEWRTALQDYMQDINSVIEELFDMEGQAGETEAAMSDLFVASFDEVHQIPQALDEATEGLENLEQLFGQMPTLDVPKLAPVFEHIMPEFVLPEFSSTPLLDDVIDQIEQLTTAINTGLSPIIDDLLVKLRELGIPVPIRTEMDPPDLGAAVVTSLAAAFAVLVGGLPLIGKIFSDEIAKIRNAVKQWALDLYEESRKAFEQSVKAVEDWATNLYEKTKEALEGAVKAVKNWATDLYEEFKKALDRAVKAIEDWATDLYKGFKKELDILLDHVPIWGESLAIAFALALASLLKGIPIWGTQLYAAIKLALLPPIEYAPTWGTNLDAAYQAELAKPIAHVKNVWGPELHSEYRTHLDSMVEYVPSWGTELQTDFVTEMTKPITHTRNVWGPNLNNAYITEMTKPITHTRSIWGPNLNTEYSTNLNNMITRTTSWGNQLQPEYAKQVSRSVTHTRNVWGPNLKNEFDTQLTKPVDALSVWGARMYETMKSEMGTVAEEALRTLETMEDDWGGYKNEVLLIVGGLALGLVAIFGGLKVSIAGALVGLVAAIVSPFTQARTAAAAEVEAINNLRANPPVIKTTPRTSTVPIGAAPGSRTTVLGPQATAIQNEINRVQSMLGTSRAHEAFAQFGGTTAYLTDLNRRLQNAKARGLRHGGITTRDALYRLSEGNKREAVVPLNRKGMTPLAYEIGKAVAQAIGPQVVEHGPKYSNLAPINVGVLIADETSIRRFVREIRPYMDEEETRLYGNTLRSIISG